MFARSGASARAQLAAIPQARDIEITGAALEHAFVQLTGGDDVEAA